MEKYTLPGESKMGKRAMMPFMTLAGAALMAIFFIAGAAIGKINQRQLNRDSNEKDQKEKIALIESVMTAKKTQALIKENEIQKQQDELQRIAIKAELNAALVKTEQLESAVQAALVLAEKPVIKKVAMNKPAQPKPSAALPALPKPAPTVVAQKKAPSTTASNSPPKSNEHVQTKSILSNIDQNAMRAQLALESKSSTPPPSAVLNANSPQASIQTTQTTVIAPSAPVATKIVVTPDMVAEANKTNKIEGVNSAKLGVSKINPDVVLLKNGGTIRIGEKFPSGETLLSLDPENGQIVTSKRTLLLF